MVAPQPYRTSFLAVTLAMTLLAYRPLARGRAATDEEPDVGGDNPGPLDWALAALALVALLHPLLVFDDFARRVVRPSVYRAQVTETFAATGDGFRLVAVASPSEAVLDYYELEGRRRTDGGWRRLEPAATPRLATLPLIATELGRRTLADQGPTRLVLTVR